VEISKDRLQKAGWLCFVWAIASVPAAAAYLVLGNAAAAHLHLLAAAIVAAGLFILMRILVTLKAFLIQVFSCHEANGALSTLMATHAVFGAILLVQPFVFQGEPDSTLAQSVRWLGAAVAFTQGVAFFILGSRVLGLPDDLSGLRQRLAYASMALGLCFGSVVLFPVGVLVGVAWLVLLGFAFQRVGNRLPAAR
jgi:hypothetical protein